MSKTIIILGINADIGKNIAEQYLKKGFKVMHPFLSSPVANTNN